MQIATVFSLVANALLKITTSPKVTHSPLITPVPTPTPVPTHTLIDVLSAIGSWIPPILQAVIGVLIAGILAKIITDWWIKKVATPKVLIGLISSPKRLEAYIVDTKIFTVEEMSADTIDFPIRVNLDTKCWFVPDKWEV